MKSLKKARTDQGLTLLQAAEKLGITANTLSNYERGASFPDVRVIKKMEDVYKTAYKDLFFEL